VRTRRKWRAWLRAHHATIAQIWLVFWKKHTGVPCLSYDDAVEEALCYGWVDSLVRRVDEDRYAQKFTPRKLDSAWSTSNRERYAALEARGLLAVPGRKRPPTAKSGDAPRPSLTAIPPDIVKALNRNRRTREAFEKLAPSHKGEYLGWIASAKKPETRAKRIRELASRLLS
jgi:uncharacterized protein YdeI (YjbR/CyaY-like superfamily)